MPVKTRMKQVFEDDSGWGVQYTAPTTGTVVDTNDPQQNGRVRVICPSWGETYNNDLVNIPWAVVSSMLSGTTEVGTRGSDLTQSTGAIAYGFWGVPKVGARVVVLCIDGDPEHRVVVGCVPDQLSAHTMPHGRWMYDEHPSVDVSSGNQRPFGPLTTSEQPIEPLNTNMRQAFSNKNEPNYEWRTRAADYSVSAVDLDHLSATYSKAPDDKDVAWEDWVSRQGYQASRLTPFQSTNVTERNLDSLVYSWTSPGFHAISMDDRQENCRMRFRTTGGHQILLDDTNERIYIATAEGRNWIEMDQAGNITHYTDGNYSVRSKGDINFTSDTSIRMFAPGIHLNSTQELRLQSSADTNIKVGGNLRIGVDGNTLLLTKDLDFTVTGDFQSSSSGNTGFKASQVGVDGDLVVSQQGFIGTQLNVIGNITAIGILVQAGEATSGFHTSPAPPPTPGPALSISPDAPDEQPAMWTSVVPDHEPYARTMTANDFTHDPEVAYTSPQVGRVARGRTILRGRYWRR